MVKIVKTFTLTHVWGVILVISLLFFMLRNSRNVIKYFGRRYASGIQQRDFDPTDRVSLQDLGEIKSPSFSVPYIKAHKSIIFSFLHHSSESSEHSNIQTHQTSDHSSHFQKVFKDPLKNFENQFLL